MRLPKLKKTKTNDSQSKKLAQSLRMTSTPNFKVFHSKIGCLILKQEQQRYVF